MVSMVSLYLTSLTVFPPVYHPVCCPLSFCLGHISANNYFGKKQPHQEVRTHVALSLQELHFDVF